jgi:hypothetical protein
VASSLLKAVYNPKAFFPHAASLRQAFAHCARFPTAASRRSLGRVSVPVWLIVLSDQLRIVALVGHYPANKLIRREPILGQRPKLPFPTAREAEGLSGINPGFPGLFRCRGQVTHVLLTRSPLSPRPKPRFSLDLHVLSAPPAFVLSQDQTLREEIDHRHCWPKPVEPANGCLPSSSKLKRCLPSRERVDGFSFPHARTDHAGEPEQPPRARGLDVNARC